jgi:cell division inhibitor SepF
MSWMRRVTEYLGLAPDDEYEDYDDYDDRDDRSQAARQSRNPGSPVTPRPAAVPASESDRPGASVRTLPVQPVRPLPVADEEDRDRVIARPQNTGPVVVRPATEPAVARPQMVSPASFGSAQEVADKFKANRPVIMNLQGLDRDLRRRLIDFASGLCYGLGGKLDKVADQVFLLTPADVQVPEEDRRRIAERGFDSDR